MSIFNYQKPELHEGGEEMKKNCFKMGLALITFAVLGLVAPWPAAAQTEVRGATEVKVGAGVSGVEFSGVNKTGRKISDFTIYIEKDCKVKIEQVTVTSTQDGGGGDWDVDDDGDGMSQEKNERDNTDSSQGTLTRVDRRGAGDENPPEKVPGESIKKDKEFKIKISFNIKTTKPCKLTITPTDENNVQLVSLPEGMQEGANEFMLDNTTAIFAGMSTAAVNATDGTVVALEFETTGDYQLMEIFEVDPQTDEILAKSDCVLGTTCELVLSNPVPSGGTISFDASFDQMSEGSTTVLTVTPVITEEITTTILSVDGTVYERDGTTAPNGLLVEVSNLSKPKLGVLTDRTGETVGEGRYSVIFINLTEESVASVGDAIQVAVTDTEGKITRTQFTLTAEEVKAGTVSRDIILSGISEFTLALSLGINMISVPLDSGDKWQMSDLAAFIGPNLTMIIHHGQVKSGKFAAYKPDFPKTSPANATVRGDQGYIVVMKAPETVTFKGTAWDGKVHLSAGINLISAPVEPPEEMKLSDLLTKIGPDATMAIWYDTERAKFVSYMTTYPEDSLSNTMVKGGVGYIITMKKATTVIFEGKAWENTPDTAAPLMVLQAKDLVSTPVLAVEGTVLMEGVGTELNGIKVTVRNLTTNQSTTDDTGATAGIGRYISTFVDLFASLTDAPSERDPETFGLRSGNRAASIGDVLEAGIVDGTRTFGGTSIRHMVTQRDIQAGIVSLDITLSPIPKESALLANYPNPFNPETWIPYKLAKDADVTMRIYNVTGQLVKTLELGHKESGFYLSKEKTAYWNGRNEAGEKVASGIYFYTIHAGNFTATKRMILVK